MFFYTGAGAGTVSCRCCNGILPVLERYPAGAGTVSCRCWNGILPVLERYSRLALERYSRLALERYSRLALERYSRLALERYSRLALEQFSGILRQVPTLGSAGHLIGMDDVAVANLITEWLTLHHASFHYGI